jgi:hypothetical protein
VRQARAAPPDLVVVCGPARFLEVELDEDRGDLLRPREVARHRCGRTAAPSIAARLASGVPPGQPWPSGPGGDLAALLSSDPSVATHGRLDRKPCRCTDAPSLEFGEHGEHLQILDRSGASVDHLEHPPPPPGVM